MPSTDFYFFLELVLSCSKDVQVITKLVESCTIVVPSCTDMYDNAHRIALRETMGVVYAHFCIAYSFLLVYYDVAGFGMDSCNIIACC